MDSNDHEPSYYEVALTNRQVVVGFVALLACVFTAFLAGVWLGRDAAPEAAEQVAEAAAPDDGAEGRRGKRIPKLTFFGEPGTAGAVADEGRRTGGARKRAGDGRRGGAGSGDEPEPSEPGEPSDPGGAADETPAAAPRRATPAPAADPEPAAAEDPASETLRRTLEAEMEAHRDAPPAEPATTPPSTMPAQPGERVQRATPPATAPAPRPAAPAAPTVATPSPAPSSVAPFWIQVYSSSNGVRAREIAASLTRSGFGVRVLEAGTTFRVRVGPYANRDLATASAGRLRREQKLDTWVTDQP